MAEDRYRYFRLEARELLEALTGGLSALEADPGADLNRLLRSAHTLKGAARVVGQAEVAEAAHALEDALAPYRAGLPVPPDAIADARMLLDRMAAAIAALAPPRPAAPAPVPVEPIETLRVELTAIEGLIESVNEAAIQLDFLRDQAGRLDAIGRLAAAAVDMAGDGMRSPLAGELMALIRQTELELARAGSRLGQELDDVRAQAEQLRLMPVSTIFPTLERAARATADALGKAVAFEAAGDDIRLDCHMLEQVREALLHVVANAIDHGLEPDGERRARGKAVPGRVRLTVERRGSRIAFVCADDGRGIDTAAIRRAADGAEPLAAIFESGVSTAAAVTQLSGRGVGLSVVREAALRLQGEVTAATAPGRGTTLTLDVPIAMAAVRALLVEVGGQTAAIPIEGVRATMRLTPEAAALSGDGRSLLLDGQAVPYGPLAPMLGMAEGASPPRFAVAIAAGEQLAAIGVQGLLRTTEVVMKPLPEVVGPLPLLAGAFFDAAGCPQPVLAVEPLVAASRDARPAAMAAARPREPVLVVDDSLTTRMLVKSILESAGYDVALATSGEEGLAMALAQPYALFVVDIEMPGMDGFEFVARTQAHARLSRVNALMLSSRHAEADRQRAAHVGARAYFVKGTFDQEVFLGAIREWASR